MKPRLLATLASLAAAGSLVYAGWEPSLFLYAFGMTMLAIGFIAFTVVAVRDLTAAFSEVTPATVTSERSRG